MITIFKNFQFHVCFNREGHSILYCVGDKSSPTCIEIDIISQQVVDADEDDVDTLALIASYHDNLQFCFDETEDYDEFKQILREDVVARATELFDFSFKMKESHESDAAYYERLYEACKHASVSCLDIVKQVAEFDHDDLSNNRSSNRSSIYMFDDKSVYECTDSDDFFYDSIEAYQYYAYN